MKKKINPVLSLLLAAPASFWKGTVHEDEEIFEFPENTEEPECNCDEGYTEFDGYGPLGDHDKIEDE